MNKKHFVIILFFFIGCAINTSAQSIKAVIGAGTNLAQVDGDQVYGFHKIGLNVGAQAMIPLPSNFFVTFEINYNEKGAFQRAHAPAPNTKEYHLRLKYAEIPVMIQYNEKDFITAGLGLSYARLLDAFEEENSGNNAPYLDTVAFNNNDYLAFFDLQFKVYKKFYMNIRYSYSLKTIRKRIFEIPSSPGSTSTRFQYNNTLMLRLNYRINEKKKSKSGLDIND